MILQDFDGERNLPFEDMSVKIHTVGEIQVLRNALGEGGEGAGVRG